MAVSSNAHHPSVGQRGKVVAKGTWHSIVRPGDPRPLEYTGESMEGKMSFFKAGAEEPEPAKASGTPAAEDQGEPEKNQAESAVEAVRKYNLRDRYLWKRLPDENVGGESAYVLAFEPKPKQNTRSREERFFGLLAGRLWVSRSDFTVLKAEAALQSPCQLFWIIARVTTFQMTYELEPVRTGNRLLRLSKATREDSRDVSLLFRSAKALANGRQVRTANPAVIAVALEARLRNRGSRYMDTNARECATRFDLWIEQAGSLPSSTYNHGAS